MKSCAAFTVAVLVASLISCQQGRAQSPEFQEALTLAQSKQQDAEDTELKRDAEFKRAASEIASARIHQALHQHWNDQDGFSLSPMDLQYVVSKFDTERIKNWMKNIPPSGNRSIRFSPTTTANCKLP